jgi:hypothetical protein
MNPSRLRYYKTLFLVAAIYDTLLGIIFTFFYRSAFSMLGIADQLPAFGGYISLIGAFLFVIGIAYFLIYFGDLYRNRDLVIVGALYKLAYCAITLFYFLAGDFPHVIFVAVFGVADLVFFVLMAECLIFLLKGKPQPVTP